MAKLAHRARDVREQRRAAAQRARDRAAAPAPAREEAGRGGDGADERRPRGMRRRSRRASRVGAQRIRQALASAARGGVDPAIAVGRVADRQRQRALGARQRAVAIAVGLREPRQRPLGGADPRGGRRRERAAIRLAQLRVGQPRVEVRRAHEAAAPGVPPASAASS